MMDLMSGVFFTVKFCKDCDSWKNTEDFNLNKRRSDGLSFYCRDCSRRRANKYYSDNPEPAKERAKAHRLADPERKKQNGAQWRAANKEYIKEYGKVWYSENKDKASESSKINYLKNKESRDAKNKDWALSNPEARREHKKRWKAKNKERVRLDSLRRRARLSEAPTVPFTETELAQKFAYWGTPVGFAVARRGGGPCQAGLQGRPAHAGQPAPRMQAVQFLQRWQMALPHTAAFRSGR